ncbi:hypothetical protein [Photobacterium lipolyticum]|uniref:Uncharacterized protein n=1 Tax=Photobacterium lipolyticum TaxID=266810 RepID=A0A2T3MW77_9GAMM|nr:hypothetical protein [Photobacterium lipolyticum]PSW04191.1 hypothetical protein C9I89_14530 [Photobacterium lipolyticum]
MNVIHMNHMNALRRKLSKKKRKFTAGHDFKSADELTLSREELSDAVELNKIISVKIDSQLMFPTFQFDEEGKVYEVLQAHLPRLLAARSGWDICFWLFTEQTVVMRDVKTDAKQLEDISLAEVLRIGAIADELTETCTARPIELVAKADSETFAAFIEDLLAPDSRKIPVLETLK